MEFCTHENILPNHFQKDRLRLVNKSALCKRKKPSKYLNKTELNPRKKDICLQVNGSQSGLQPTFKLVPDRRAVSESKLNVIDYSQTRIEDCRKSSTETRKSTVLIQTWERRSQTDCKKLQILQNNHCSTNQPQKAKVIHYTKNQDTVLKGKSTKTMLDHPLQVNSNMSTTKFDRHYIGCNGTTKLQDTHKANFKRPSYCQAKPRPKSLNLPVSDGPFNEEPEWISLSKKLCAKFVQSHLEPDVSIPDVPEWKNNAKDTQPKAVPKAEPVIKPQEAQKFHSNFITGAKTPEKPQWIDLSRKLCNKFIEEHIECEPCDVENHRISPNPGLVSEAPKTEVRIIEKLGRRINTQEQNHTEQPEWITLSRRLRAKFIEGHRDDPDTISLDNQLNASDLEEYGSDWKNHQSYSESQQIHQSQKLIISPGDKTNHKTAKIKDNYRDAPETTQNAPMTISFCYWSDIAPCEQELDKKSYADSKQFHSPCESSSNHSQCKSNDDVNYELTFEDFETEHLTSGYNSPSENVTDEYTLTSSSQLDIPKNVSDYSEQKKCRSMGDLTCVFDCDSLEYSLTSTNNDPKEKMQVQFQNKLTEHNCDYKTEIEHEAENTEFIMDSPGQDRINGEITHLNHKTDQINDSSRKFKTNVCTISQYQHDLQLNTQKCCTEIQVKPEAPHNSCRDLTQNISSTMKSDNFSDNAYCSKISESNSFDENFVTNSEPKINHHSQNSESKRVAVSSDSTKQETKRECRNSENLHSSSLHQQEQMNYVENFQLPNNKFISDVHVKNSHGKEEFSSKNYDETLKCKIKVPHCIPNNQQEIKSRDEFSKFQNSQLSNSILEKGQMTERSKEKRTRKASGGKRESTSRNFNGDLKVNQWSSDQNGKALSYSTETVEYENIPANLTYHDQRFYSKKLSDSNEINDRKVKASQIEGLNENIIDNNSSYRPINPPLEFEMFEIPSLCSPENKKVLLNTDSKTQYATNYGSDNSKNENFNRRSDADRQKNESSDSETPNSTPFDARTLVSPSSYASDSETSSWTLTKDNSYAANRSPVPDTDVSDCSLSVKCDYTPSCSNQSTMESKTSSYIDTNGCATAKDHSSKTSKPKDNRFTEVFVDCETAKNWKKSHSLDHLEDKFSTASSSSFYVHLQDDLQNSTAEPSKSVEKTDSIEAMPESLRHLFNLPHNNPIYTPAAKTSMLLSKTAEQPPCHYYSIASSGTSSVKEPKTSKKSKKSDRSSSLKIKDIAQGIILTFRKFHSHSKSSHVSSSHYVDVSHLAENNVSSNSNNPCQNDFHNPSNVKDIQEVSNTYGKVHTSRTFNATYFGNRSTSESNLYQPINSSKLCTCDTLNPPKKYLESDERSKSFNFGMLTEAKQNKSHKKTPEMKEKKSKNSHHGGKNRSKKLEPKATSSVSRKVQQMADGTLYLVTTVSGDTAVPGVYSDSPDTGSEISSHAPTKRPGESNC